TGGLRAGGDGASTWASSILEAIILLIVAPDHAHEQRVRGIRAKRGDQTAPAVGARQAGGVRRQPPDSEHRHLVAACSRPALTSLPPSQRTNAARPSPPRSTKSSPSSTAHRPASSSTAVARQRSPAAPPRRSQVPRS